MSSPLADLIQRGESGRENYDAYNRGTYIDGSGRERIRGADGPIDFSSMTLGQVMDAQALPRGDEQRLFAVGRYQVIPDTMSEAVGRLGLDRSQSFTPELQDRIFADHLISRKRPEIRDYIEGDTGATLHRAQRAAAQEWASVADPSTGRSYYDKPNGANHATISSAEMGQALNQMRDAYREAVERGASPEEAWRQINGQPAQDLGQRAPGRQDPAADGLLRLDERGAPVRELQETLNRLGHTDAQGRPLETDGRFGPRTEQAVEAFQRAHGLEVDGVVGPETRKALERAQQEDRQQDAGNRQSGAAPERDGLDALMDAAKRGDVAAMRAAMTDFAASPQGREWLQQGGEQCQAQPSRQSDTQVQQAQEGSAR